MYTVKIRPHLALLAVLAVAGAVSEVQAQPKGPPPPGPPPPGMRGSGDRSDELRQDVLEKMRAMRAWKLTEVLKLDEMTSAKLFPLLAKYDDRERDLMKERNDVLRGMRAEIEAPKPDNARLTGYIDRLLQSRAKQKAIEDDKIKDIRKILSPVQQAKLYMLLPRIEQQFQQRIRQAMEDRRRWRGGGGDDPFGP